MKQFKITMIATIVTCMIIIGCAYALPANIGQDPSNTLTKVSCAVGK